MKIGRLFKKAVRFAKNNPELVLTIAGAVAPKLARKAAPIITGAGSRPKED